MTDRWLGGCLTLVAILWLWLAQVYIPDGGSEGEPGPRGFPMLLGLVLAVLGISLVVQSLIRSSASRQRAAGVETRGGELADKPPDDHPMPPVTRREAVFASATFALLILYAFLLDKVGFIIGTPIVMVLALSAVLRVRRWLASVSLAVGFTFICWLVFSELLATPLPRGTWIAWL